MANSWYVITGGPAVGKTTLLQALEKLGHHTVPEAARRVIDQGLSKGLTIQDIRKDEKKFQEDVARLKAKTESALNREKLTFFDRGMHDTIAYLKAGAHAIEDWVWELAKASTYDAVFLLDPRDEYEEDYARVEDPKLRERIQRLLHEAYSQGGMKVIRVPLMSTQDRVAFILKHVGAKA